jgi:methylated-DNA-[protein]-cysteine S-methyltransferase
MPELTTLITDLPPGRWALVATARGLADVRLLTDEPAPPGAEGAGDVLREAEQQLREYFAGTRREFNLPLDLSGRTPFQERVLAACLGVGYGETASYGEVARRAGHPGAARAVGQVMATNRLALVVPCHRVVAGSGGLGGYGGGLALKARLLAMEAAGVGWAGVVEAEANSVTGSDALRVDLVGHMDYNTRGYSRLVYRHRASTAGVGTAATGWLSGRSRVHVCQGRSPMTAAQWAQGLRAEWAGRGRSVQSDPQDRRMGIP